MARPEAERKIVEYAPGVISPLVFSRLVDQDPRFASGYYVTESERRKMKIRLYIIDHYSIRQARLSAACQSKPEIVKQVLFEKAVLRELISRGDDILRNLKSQLPNL